MHLPRLLVFDTSVLMHDSRSLVSCDTDDILITDVVLNELDNNKNGFGEQNRNARAASRYLDLLSSKLDIAAFDDGVPLALTGQKQAKGRFYLESETVAQSLRAQLAEMPNNDHRIIALAEYYKMHMEGRWSDVLVISNDVNFRIAARRRGLMAEQYVSDHHESDDEVISPNVHEQHGDFWEKLPDLTSFKKGAETFYTFKKLIRGWDLHDLVRVVDGDSVLSMTVEERGNRSMVLRVLRDHSSVRNAVWGITARNEAQNFGLNLLMDPSIHVVYLIGKAGSGKTLLTLAAGLTQTFDLKLYNEIIMTRLTVPVGEDIGFLPGNEREKMEPWMGALYDNLEVLTKADESGGDWGKKATFDLVTSKISIKALNFMRGRTLIEKFLIIDEAQNLTPKQMKTIL
ncbi:MAG TPA: PhoH family protein, partial [Candidatus Paceibacterota bacterium]|nr:PhoH family protein [Candidatus Paceibacterota bacterium]